MTTSMEKLKLAYSVLADTFSKWNEHKAIRMGAALAYFGIFAIAPVLIIAIAIAGLVYGRAATEGNIVRSISGVVGSSTAQFAQGLIESASQPGKGVIAAVVGVVGIVLGSTGLFFQLKGALNTVWEVVPKPGYRLVDMIRDNALSFAIVLGLGVLMLASLLLTAGVSAIGSLLGSAVPGGRTIWWLVDFGLSFGLVTLLFAGIFKILPDVRIPWGDVWPGAILTALLFAVAQVALGAIIRLANPGLAFGAAGALVVILVWVDLVSLILLFGAEFICVYSRRFGSRAQPKAYAEALTAEARAAQGRPAKKPATTNARDNTVVRAPACWGASFEVMTHALATCAPDTSVAHVVAIMRDRDIDNVLVVENGKVCGIVTDRDLALQALTGKDDPLQTPIRKFMITKVVMGEAAWSLEQVVKIMAKHQIRHLPIAQDGQLVGIVSLDDVAWHENRKDVI